MADRRFQDMHGSPPDLPTARSWAGSRLDDIYGSGVGNVEDVYVDQQDFKPEWLLVHVGRGQHRVLVPIAEAAAGAGHVWVPYEREAIRSAPAVAGTALTQVQELRLCEHYKERRRATKIADIDPGAITTVAVAVAPAERGSTQG